MTMRVSLPNRKLRKLVFELASAEPQDVEVILSELTASERAKVDELLAQCRGENIHLVKGPELALSNWLRERLDRGALDRGQMTAHAASALQASVAAVQVRAESDAPAKSPPSVRLGRRERLGSWLLRSRGGL